MQFIATDVALSVCLSVGHVHEPYKTEPVEVVFGIWTRVGPGNHVLGLDPHLEQGASLEDISRPIVKCRKYSVGGSSDAAFNIHYCSKVMPSVL